MLGEAVKKLKSQKSGSTADELADGFEEMAKQITSEHAHWTATRSIGADGSHVFMGEAGEALIISPDKGIFRGRVLEPGLNRLDSAKRWIPDYSKLTEL
jgi:hypothetical protein